MIDFLSKIPANKQQAVIDAFADQLASPRFQSMTPSDRVNQYLTDAVRDVVMNYRQKQANQAVTPPADFPL